MAKIAASENNSSSNRVASAGVSPRSNLASGSFNGTFSEPLFDAGRSAGSHSQIKGY